MSEFEKRDQKDDENKMQFDPSSDLPTEKRRGRPRQVDIQAIARRRKQAKHQDFAPHRFQDFAPQRVVRESSDQLV